jgi:hypothetical protein
VTPATSRMETQRRAAVALLAFIAVAGALVVGVYAVGGQRQPSGEIRSMNVAQQAFDAAAGAVATVSGPGVDLIADDRRRALELLTQAYQKLDEAQEAGYPVSEITPLRAKVTAGLDRLYGVVYVKSNDVFSFPADKPVTLTGLVRGADGAPYVLDTANKTVWRIDLAKKTASPIAKAGQRESGTKVADPKLLVTGGPDVLVLDSKNNLWRWRKTDNKGNGTLVKVPIKDSATWGSDINVMSTFVANFDAAFYKLYLVDPSEQNIMVLSPANDGSGYPLKPTGRLPTDRPVDGITDLLIDGDIYVAENGAVARVIPATSWTPKAPADAQVRPDPRYTKIAATDRPDGGSTKGIGSVYAYDEANRRIVAFNKSNGDYVEQYMLPAGDTGWASLRDFVVLPGADADAPVTVWWISDRGLHTAVLEAVEAPVASPSPGASQPGASPGGTTTPRPKPTKTPKP